jgi:phosphoglycerol transferase
MFPLFRDELRKKRLGNGSTNWSTLVVVLIQWISLILLPLVFVIVKHGFSLQSMKLPLMPSGDALMYASTVQSFLTPPLPNFLFSDRFGSPVGQDLTFSLVSVDLFAPAVAALFAALSGDLFFGINLFYIIGYPLTAIFGFLALRILAVSRFVAVLSGIAISLLPFHFFWNTHSITLSTYFLLPLAIALVVSMATTPNINNELKTFTGKDGLRGTIGTRLKFIFFAVLGASYSYWAFGIAFLICVSILYSARQGRKELILPLLKSLFSVVFGFLLVAIPSLLVLAQSPATNYLAQRNLAGGVLNGTSLQSIFTYPPGSLSFGLVDALIPGTGNKLLEASNLWIERGFSSEGFAPTAFTSLFLTLAFVLAYFLIPRLNSLITESQSQRLSILLFFVPWSLLLASVGGIGAVFSIYVSSALRGFSRFWILLVIIAIFVIAIFITEWFSKQKTKFLPVVAIALVALSIVDSFSVVGNVKSDTVFAAPKSAGVETVSTQEVMNGFHGLLSELKSLEPRSDVLNLPITHYPYESPGYPSYRLLLPGLIESNYRWSAGATEGSPAFEPLLRLREEIVLSPKSLADSARSLGFEAIVIDQEVWDAMHEFRPWPEYQGHPEISLTDFLAETELAWSKFQSKAGTFYVFELTE